MMKARDYGLDPAHFLRYVIRPTLPRIALDSPSAQVQVLGIGLVESGLRWLDQLDKRTMPGPAYGLYGMEKATHDDLWSFLRAKIALRLSVGRLSLYSGFQSPPDVTELWANLAYATAMCRVKVYRAPPALPDATDALGHANYHKVFYNTMAGATVVSESVKHFEFAVRCVADTK
jgi:hypothetical protein